MNPVPRTDALLSDWSTLFDLLPVAAYRSLPGGRPVRANAAMVRLNGFDSEAALLAEPDIATRWYARPESGDEFRRRLAADGVVRGFVYEACRLRDGERIWVSENAHAVRDAAGAVAYYEGTVEDITQRMQAQQALERADAQWRRFAAQFPGVVFTTRLRPGQPPAFEFVSEGVREVYGITAEEAMRDPGVLQRMRHPDDSATVERGLSAARQGGMPHSAQFRIVRRDGQVRWVMGTTNLIAHDEDGDLRSGVIVDITAEHEAAQLRSERDRAEAARRLTSSLMSRISHELRTPLNAVLGFAQLLEAEPTLAPRSRQWASHIVTSGRHLLALVEDVLDLTAADSGELQVHVEVTDPAAALQDAFTMIAGQAQAAGVTLLGPAAPVPQVLADPRRLRQVLTNLLSNAVKYNRPGGEVRVSLARCGPRVDIAVADTGAGMTPAQCAAAFQPFNRLGAERSTVTGTGLGLALSRQLALAMGGDIAVDSTPGVGTCFTLTLPTPGTGD